MTTRLIALCMACLALTGCPPAVAPPVKPEASGPFVFDADSDRQLAGLTPELSPGNYIYGVYFMLPNKTLTDAADVEIATVSENSAGLSFSVKGSTVETDLFGRFLSSNDGSGSAETVQRFLLPGTSLSPNATCDTDRICAAPTPCRGRTRIRAGAIRPGAPPASRTCEPLCSPPRYRISRLSPGSVL